MPQLDRLSENRKITIISTNYTNKTNCMVGVFLCLVSYFIKYIIRKISITFSIVWIILIWTQIEHIMWNVFDKASASNVIELKPNTNFTIWHTRWYNMVLFIDKHHCNLCRIIQYRIICFMLTQLRINTIHFCRSE